MVNVVTKQLIESKANNVDVENYQTSKIISNKNKGFSWTGTQQIITVSLYMRLIQMQTKDF